MAYKKAITSIAAAAALFTCCAAVLPVAQVSVAQATPATEAVERNISAARNDSSKAEYRLLSATILAIQRGVLDKNGKLNPKYIGPYGEYEGPTNFGSWLINDAHSDYVDAKDKYNNSLTAIKVALKNRQQTTAETEAADQTAILSMKNVSVKDATSLLKAAQHAVFVADNEKMNAVRAAVQQGIIDADGKLTPKYTGANGKFKADDYYPTSVYENYSDACNKDDYARAAVEFVNNVLAERKADLEAYQNQINSAKEETPAEETPAEETPAEETTDEATDEVADNVTDEVADNTSVVEDSDDFSAELQGDDERFDDLNDFGDMLDDFDDFDFSDFDLDGLGDLDGLDNFDDFAGFVADDDASADLY